MKTTLLDLHLSASGAAFASLEKKTAHELASFKLQRFNGAKHHPADYQEWVRAFDQLREYFVDLGKKPAPSADQAPAPTAEPAAPAK